MHAVIRTKGKQFRVASGDEIRFPLMEAEAGERVTFEEVLSVEKDDGIKVGTPLVQGAKVTGTVLGHGKDKKILIWKHKRRKNYRKKQGHRQDFTRVVIDDISA